ncbi:iron-sulfur cluster repair protein YtfE [Crenobacter caeni]|uniref:Iron-sulfur cluster repair protein YtfE n=1 Tax=Crenobacter caeni TaxID=2705474 RepID=A0A6B2KUV6_9NEIS|nr:iron-sulfur cluster repair protein YtfE [Crenobacter caeni]NDV14026.1 iron-sulfur cluster repair protein YtfE [Crenobacter caeni]
MTTQQTAIVIDATQPIGQIAVALPGAIAVFRRLKLDYCCGGQISLQKAAQDKDLSLEPILAELAALQRQDDTPEFASAGALIDHILERYHDVHRAQLPELIEMAKCVEAVHRGHANVPAGLAVLLTEMQAELFDHMKKEELILFPMLRTGGNPYAANPIGMMRSEHVEHGATLEYLAAKTNDMIAPNDACTTWQALYAGLRQLREDLINHIHLENNVLFPQFENNTASTGCGPNGCACSGM